MVRDRGKGVEREIAFRRESCTRIKLEPNQGSFARTPALPNDQAPGCGRRHQDQNRQPHVAHDRHHRLPQEVEKIAI
jgi:hypothetical protein